MPKIIYPLNTCPGRLLTSTCLSPTQLSSQAPGPPINTKHLHFGVPNVVKLTFQAKPIIVSLKLVSHSKVFFFSYWHHYLSSCSSPKPRPPSYPLPLFSTLHIYSGITSYRFCLLRISQICYFSLSPP